MSQFVQHERVSRLCLNGAGGLSRWAQGLARSVYVLLRACACSTSPATHFNANHPRRFSGAVPQANLKGTSINSFFRQIAALRGARNPHVP